MLISGTGIASGTYITGGSGTSWTMSSSNTIPIGTLIYGYPTLAVTGPFPIDAASGYNTHLQYSWVLANDRPINGSGVSPGTYIVALTGGSSTNGGIGTYALNQNPTSGSTTSGIFYPGTLGYKIMTSNNGKNWTLQSTPTTGSPTLDPLWTDIDWSPYLRQFFAVARYSSTSQTRYMVSPDGLSWTFTTSPQVSGTDIQWNKCNWNPTQNTFLALGSHSNTSSTTKECNISSSSILPSAVSSQSLLAFNQQIIPERYNATSFLINGSISGSTLTVNYIYGNTAGVYSGMLITGSNFNSYFTGPVYIVQQGSYFISNWLTGPGTYQLSQSSNTSFNGTFALYQTTCQFIGSISGTTLTVSSVNSGYLAVGMTILGFQSSGASLTSGTYITAQTSYSSIPGFFGTYTINNSQTALSQTLVGYFAPTSSTNDISMLSAAWSPSLGVFCAAGGPISTNSQATVTGTIVPFGGTVYNTGTVSQSTATITGVGTTFTSAMVGGFIVFNTGVSAPITGYTSATVLTSSLSQTVTAGTTYNIYYGTNTGSSSSISGNTLTIGGNIQGSFYPGMTIYASTVYNVGTASQSGTTILGSGTSWTSSMVGGYIVYGTLAIAPITAFINSSQLSSTTSQAVASSIPYNIYYGTTYSTGTATQSGNVITGSGTTFTSSMVWGYILYTNGTSQGQVAQITNYTSTTSLTVTSSLTVSTGSTYVIFYNTSITPVQILGQSSGTFSSSGNYQISGISQNVSSVSISANSGLLTCSTPTTGQTLTPGLVLYGANVAANQNYNLVSQVNFSGSGLAAGTGGIGGGGTYVVTSILPIVASSTLTGCVHTALSPDGKTWTAQGGVQPSTGALATSNALAITSITWSPSLGLFLGVSQFNYGGGGTASTITMRSTLGMMGTWIAGNINTVASNLCRSIVWAPEIELFTVVGQAAATTAGLIQTSPDGVTWTNQTPTIQSLYSVAWSGAPLYLFVAVSLVGAAASLMTSSNGTTWTTVTLTPCPSTTASLNAVGTSTAQWTSVCWSPDLQMFAAVSNTTGNNTYYRAITSKNGTTWTWRQTTTETTAEVSFTNIIWCTGLGRFVAIGSAGDRIMSSPDGVTWYHNMEIFPSTWYGSAFSSALNTLVLVGSPSATSSPNIIPTSSGNFAYAYGSVITTMAAVGATNALAVGTSTASNINNAMALGSGIVGNITGGTFLQHRVAPTDSSTTSSCTFISGTNELIERPNYYCEIGLSASTTVASGNVIPWDTIISDDFFMSNLTANGFAYSITVPVSGLYFIGLMLGNAAEGTTSTQIMLQINGNLVLPAAVFSTPSATITITSCLNISRVIYLSAGTYIQVAVRNATLTVSSGGVIGNGFQRLQVVFIR